MSPLPRGFAAAQCGEACLTGNGRHCKEAAPPTQPFWSAVPTCRGRRFSLLALTSQRTPRINRPPILRWEGPMAGLETCLRVLRGQLVTAHRPTVPPRGERTPIIITIAALTRHIQSPTLLRLVLSRAAVKQPVSTSFEAAWAIFLNVFKK